MWILAWTVISWKCPVPFVPEKFKPLVCQASLEPGLYVTEDPQGILEKLEDLGAEVPTQLQTVSWDEKSNFKQRLVRPKWRAEIE